MRSQTLVISKSQRQEGDDNAQFIQRLYSYDFSVGNLLSICKVWTKHEN